ncbi:hypothetical protein WA026_015205 [Henosepilachna vigintioctopunctata]|uniref:Uncharacterized protein n=1 Tax=Henosepilachna vigintioctopunctata TaxID=420089 RepID=A0AAW1TNU4_9CUCU
MMDELKRKFVKLLLENHKLRKENEDIKTRVKGLELEIQKLREKFFQDKICKKQTNLIIFKMATEDITQTNVLKVLLKCVPDVTEKDFDIQVVPSKNSKKPTLVKFDKPEKCRNVLPQYKLEGGCCGSTKKITVVGGWAWAWWLVTDVQRLSLEVMTLNPCCENVETAQGVPLTVTGVAQCKIMKADELLQTASEQFLGKSVKEIKSTILQTLEGHLRAILVENHCDIVGVSESWLKPHVSSASLNVDGYNFIRRDRDRRGRGVGLYLSNNLDYRILNTSRHIEDLYLTILHP